MDLNEVRETLLDLQKELELRVERTHRHTYGRDEPVSANFSEQAKQTENDELVMNLEADGLREIAQIRAALRRIDEKRYGICAYCGKPINEQRLQAIPYTNSCIDCAD